jgi:uncharacterized tellurite resistance protein B-like protein
LQTETKTTPDEELNRIEKYLQFMIHLMRADGRVDQDEKRHMMSLMVDGLKLDPTLTARYRAALEEKEFSEPSDEQLSSIFKGLDPASLAHLVRDAYGMAGADGEIHESELRLLQRSLAIAGVPESRFENIDAWARHSLELNRIGELLLDPNYRDVGE